MSRAQRDKGRRFERECAALLNDSVPGADATLRYGQEEFGGALGDIESTVGNWECKRREQLAKDMCPKPDVRGVFCRSDRGECLLVMRAIDVLKLIRARDDYSCACGGARCVPVPVYDEHGRYTGMWLEKCGCER